MLFHSTQSYASCDQVVSREAQAVNECPYRNSSSPWQAPAEAEWSRDIKGVRSGIVNFYVHGELSQIISRLTLAGWSQAMKNNKQDNHLYMNSVVESGLKKHELKKVQDQIEKLKGTRSCDEDLKKGCLSKGALDTQIETLQEKLNSIQTSLSSALQNVETMPVSDEFFCGEVEVAAFELFNNPFGGRHHLRIFDTHAVDRLGKKVWAIVANRDIKIVFDHNRPNQGFLNHELEPDADDERDRLNFDLTKVGAILKSKIHKVNFSCEAPPDKATSADGLILSIWLK